MDRRWTGVGPIGPALDCSSEQVRYKQSGRLDPARKGTTVPSCPDDASETNSNLAQPIGHTWAYEQGVYGGSLRGGRQEGMGSRHVGGRGANSERVRGERFGCWRPNACKRSADD